MNKQQQLQTAPDADLPALLGEILQPETGTKHDQLACQYINCHKISPVLEQITAICPRCKKPSARKLIRVHERYLQVWEYDTPCTVRPIDIKDANLAKTFRDKSIEKHGSDNYFRAIYSIWVNQFNPHTGAAFEVWISCFAKPKHIFKACAALELSSEVGE